MLLAQIVTITAANIRNIPSRWQESLVLVVAVGGVTAVVIGLLALLQSLAATVEGTSRPDRVIVLAGAAASEAMSNLTRETASIAEVAPGVKVERQQPLIVKEVVMSITVPQSPAGEFGEVTLRGTAPKVLGVRPEIELVQGQMFQSGRKQVVLGRLIQSTLSGAPGVGDTVTINNEPWQVVGVFASGGDLHESEIWADAETVLSTFRKSSYQSVTALLDGEASIARFREYFETQASLNVRAVSEREYFQAQSARLNALLGGVASVAGTLMGIGALLATISAMMAALLARYREIGILWALGFGAGPVIVSLVVETLLLALLGALLGSLAIFVILGTGVQINTVIGNASKTVFNLQVGSRELLFGIMIACAIALLGCLPPAIRARSLSVTELIRSL